MRFFHVLRRDIVDCLSIAMGVWNILFFWSNIKGDARSAAGMTDAELEIDCDKKHKMPRGSAGHFECVRRNLNAAPAQRLGRQRKVLFSERSHAGFGYP